jgi:hypothetical protein
MSEQFKVGEICIVQNATHNSEKYNGTECVVVSGWELRVASIGKEYLMCLVRLCDGKELYACDFHLRRKPPKQGLTEWANAKVKQLLSMQPIKEQEPA